MSLISSGGFYSHDFDTLGFCLYFLTYSPSVTLLPADVHPGRQQVISHVRGIGHVRGCLGGPGSWFAPDVGCGGINQQVEDISLSLSLLFY